MPSITRISSRAFNQDIGSAKRAADEGTVIITDRGAPAYVLLSHAAWRRLQNRRPSLREALALPGVEDIDFDPPTLGPIGRPAEFGGD